MADQQRPPFCPKLPVSRLRTHDVPWGALAVADVIRVKPNTTLVAAIDAQDAVVSPASVKPSAAVPSPHQVSSRDRFFDFVQASGPETEDHPRVPDAKVKPFDQIEWDRRTAEITTTRQAVFKQENVRSAQNWSVRSSRRRWFYSKYFTVIRQIGARAVRAAADPPRHSRTIADWGIKDGYFSKEDGEVFYEELTWLCVNQYGLQFPVWFNVGLPRVRRGQSTAIAATGIGIRKPRKPAVRTRSMSIPRAVACFIQSVQDNMENIMELAYAEAMLFKFGLARAPTSPDPVQQRN